MALISRLGGVAVNYLKPLAATAFAVKSSTRQAVSSAPTISSGTGVPTEASPDGSLWLRTDGTNGDDSLYMRIAGAWVALAGQTP